jgi:hypothetical protein
VTPQIPSRPRGRAWIYSIAWLPILAIYVTLFATNGMPLGLAFRGGVANVLPSALLGLWVLRVPRRLPLPERHRPRFFMTHGALLLAFLVASAAGWMGLVFLDKALFGGAMTVRMEVRLLPWRALNDLLVYCSLLGLGYAWHSAAAGRERSWRRCGASSTPISSSTRSMPWSAW